MRWPFTSEEIDALKRVAKADIERKRTRRILRRRQQRIDLDEHKFDQTEADRMVERVINGR